jgi:hypothetical protein
MREKVLGHAASLLGGMIHNLNTPLMWIMGRSQLLMARNEIWEKLRTMSDEDFLKTKDKNTKDLDSITQGTDKIDAILKNLSYKVQMSTEGFTAIEIRDYLRNEMDFLLADMRFKHETKLELNIDDSRSFYTKLDYNALSWAVTSIIGIIISSTSKGRTIRVGFSGDTISITCPEIAFDPGIKDSIDSACSSLREYSAVSASDNEGMTIRLKLKGN